MAEPASAGHAPTQNRWDLLEVLRRLAGLLAVPATFYAVGYLIVFAYVLSTELQAWFWFTEAFYREAGATFLIDALMSVALLPQVFVTLSALLIVLFPGVPSLPAREAGFARFHSSLGFLIHLATRRPGFFIVMMGAVVLTGYLMQGCTTWICLPPKPAFVGSWLVGEPALDAYFARRPGMYRGAMFFAVAIPTLVALGMLTLRTWMLEIRPPPSGEGREAAKPPLATRPVHPLALLLLTSAFTVLAVVVPVGYGFHFYDLVAAPVTNAQQCVQAGEPSTDAKRATPTGATTAVGVDCFLLGKFDAHYILIGKEIRFRAGGALEQAEDAGLSNPLDYPHDPRAYVPRIYIRQVTELEPFSIKATEPQPVRQVVTLPSTRGSVPLRQ